MRFHEARLNPDTARLAEGADVVCAFVNDYLGSTVIAELAKSGVRLIALRSAAFSIKRVAFNCFPIPRR